MEVARLFAELKNRSLYRVTVIYAAAAWLSLQIADIVVESFDWPEQLMQLLIFAALIGFPLVLALFWFMAEPEQSAVQSVPQTTDVGDAPVDQRPGLIVLPFACFSDYREDAWAADALTEDLTTLIARCQEYSVIARNTAFTYKDVSVDVRELADDLGVRYVLEGSLRRQPDKLRVTAQLIEAQSGSHLWAEQYDRGVEEFAQLHDELCQSIALKLGNELTRAEMNFSLSKPPAQWSTLEKYQQARGTLQFKGWNRDSFAEVAQLLQEVVADDPEFAPAQGYLSLILALGYLAHLYPEREAALAASIAAGQRAMTLAPESSEVLGYVGCALSDVGNHDRGIPIIERAIELNPSNSQAFAALGAAKVVSGRVEEGIANLRHAVSISPADPGLAPWSTILSIALCYTGEREEALSWAQYACGADPRYFASHLARAMALASLDRSKEASRAVSESKRLNPDLSETAISALMGDDAVSMLMHSGVMLNELIG